MLLGFVVVGGGVQLWVVLLCGCAAVWCCWGEVLLVVHACVDAFARTSPRGPLHFR